MFKDQGNKITLQGRDTSFAPLDLKTLSYNMHLMKYEFD